MISGVLAETCECLGEKRSEDLDEGLIEIPDEVCV